MTAKPPYRHLSNSALVKGIETCKGAVDSLEQCILAAVAQDNMDLKSEQLLQLQLKELKELRYEYYIRGVKWITRDKKEVMLVDMTGDHLRNCIYHLRRHAGVYRLRELYECDSALGMLQGEMAIEAAENDLLRLAEMDDIEFLVGHIPVYRLMLKEALWRTLEPKQKLQEFWEEVIMWSREGSRTIMSQIGFTTS